MGTQELNKGSRDAPVLHPKQENNVFCLMIFHTDSVILNAI